MEIQHKDSIEELINSAQWVDALEAIEAKRIQGELSKSDFMSQALVYFKLNHYDKVLTIFQNGDWSDYKDCAWLRRLFIAPAIKAKNYILAEKLLELILKNHPNSILDLTSLGSLLIRQNKRSEATTYLEKILVIDPENYRIAAQLIQIRLQSNQLEEALILVKHYEYAYDLDERLLKISLQVLAKTKNIEFALNKIAAMNLAKYSLDVGILAAQIAFDRNAFALVEKILNELKEVGYQEAKIDLILAKVKLVSGDNEIEAIALLRNAYKQDSENIQVNNLLGDLFLKSGNYQEALIHFEKIKEPLASNPQTRIQNAKALKYLGQYEAAANEMLEVVKLLPSSVKWKRYTASALGQAGRSEEAAKIFNEGVALRNKDLAKTFKAGLEQLEAKLENLHIPQARFNWLNDMLKTHDPRGQTEDYEKKAKWVNLVDHFLIDWLECRPHQADEAMLYFEDLSKIYAVLQEKLNEGKGVILAGAHVGPLFSIPLALEMLGLPHKWLASTPKVSSMSYNDSLISTGENTEAQVVRQIIKNLNEGKIIALAIDGAINPAAPRVDFENQRITYSDFAAKMSYRTKAPSIFTVSRWKDNRFCIQLEPLPAALEGECLEEFCSRWKESYLKLLRDFLVKNPENARLSGGIWRDIKR